jgi:glycosyltransferase involved in cell wall biosynthesis
MSSETFIKSRKNQINIIIGMIFFTIVSILLIFPLEKDVINVNHRDTGEEVQTFSNVYPTSKRIKLCIQTPNFVEYGGIESWISNSIDLLRELGINYIGILMTMIYSKRFFNLVTDKHLHLLSDEQDVLKHCDVLLQNAHFPLTGINKFLVIHGGTNCTWTNRYIRTSVEYDGVIGVSQASLNQIEGGNKFILPGYVPLDDTPVEPICGKQLLFVGRLGDDKRPDIFCKLLEKMKEYCGVMIGPSYHGGFKCSVNNVIILEPSKHVQGHMRNSKALIVPSDAEGGPLVAIEAIINKIPVFIKNIGVAKLCPNDFNIVEDWDTFNFPLFPKIPGDCIINYYSKHNIKLLWNDFLIFTESLKIDQSGSIDWHVLFSGCKLKYTGKILTLYSYFGICETKIRLYQVYMKKYSQINIYAIKMIEGSHSIESENMYDQTNERIILEHKKGFSDVFIRLDRSQVQLLTLTGI